MLGTIVIGHGNFPSGIVSAVELLMGANQPQLTTVELTADKSTDTFLEELKSAVSQVDTGEGVVIFSDIVSGTPCNMAKLLACDHIRVIGGFNLITLIAFLSEREYPDLDLGDIVAVGAQSMELVQPLQVPQAQDADDEEL